MREGGFLEVVGGNWGGVGAPQQHRQPLADPPSLDSTDPKISAFHNVTFTSPRSSTVRTLDRRTSWAPRRSSIKASAPSSKEPPLPSTPSFWEWVAPSTSITRWSLLRSWVWFSKRKTLLPSFMFILQITLPNLIIPDVPFPALLLTLIRRRFQVKPAALLIPIAIFFFLWWRSFTVPGTKVASFPELMWGVIFIACLVFSLLPSFK